jgi:hypothetical protein
MEFTQGKFPFVMDWAAESSGHARKAQREPIATIAITTSSSIKMKAPLHFFALGKFMVSFKNNDAPPGRICPV